MSNSCIHDSRVISYEVFCEQRTIVLHIVYRDAGEPFKYADIIFSEVIAYDFQNDGAFGSILSDIHQVPAIDIYAAQGNLLREGITWGWVGEWANSIDRAEKFFRENHLHGFEIEASLGLKGWVIAKQKEEKPAKTN